MTPTPCQSLDDFLAHDLTGEALARFTAHLTDCPGCRRAVSEHERLDALLAEATAPVPAGLSDRVERRLRTTRRRRVVALAAALAATVAAVWLLGRTVPRPVEPEPVVVQAPPEATVPEASRPANRIRVTFPAGANVFAVPVQAESPNVSFFQVFRDLRADHKPAPATHPPHSPTERND
jgi:anti-sigma factor RsiW